jgi:hypothetical protein
MWAGGSSADVPFEIEVELRIEFQTIAVHVDDMDLPVAVYLDHPARHQIFNQEVIRNHDLLVILCEAQIMWA